MRKGLLKWGLVLVALVLWPLGAQARPSKCEECHLKVTPGIVKDFHRSKMSKVLACYSCHGKDHMSADDVEKAKLPTIETCKRCHPKQARQYMAGKHFLGWVAMEAMPTTHMQPGPVVKGRKGCGGCHSLGATREAKKNPDYPKYAMDCQNCHTRHAFSVKEAREPEACMTCHMGFDHPQWEMWSTSKHGAIYRIDRMLGRPLEDRRGPRCQTCHMPNGDHRVMTAWGFLGLRVPEDDKEWWQYRVTILKALHVLTPDGKFTKRLEVVKAGKVARLSKEEWQAERDRMLKICSQCHNTNFAREQLQQADQMLKAADKLMAEAIETVADLAREGIIKHPDGNPYPDLLRFYETPYPIEQKLYLMFMEYRMRAFQGAFHMNPDYSHWYGWAKMKETLAEIKSMAREMRKEAGK